MPSTSADAARRFAEDLRAAREDRGVALERLYEASRIPLDVLRSFEQDGLSDNRMFNRVYLRSLVRTYADAVGLPVLPVLDALDGALDGRYDGQIAALVAPPAPAAEPNPAAGAAEGPSPEAVDSKLETTPAPRAPKRKAARRVDPEEESPASETPDTAATAPLAETPVAVPDVPLPPGASGRVKAPADPVGVSPSYAPQIPSPDPSRYGLERERRLPGWTLALFGVIAFVVLAGGIAWWLSRDDEAADNAPAQVTAPTPTARPDSAAPAAPLTPVALPDTLRLVLAATGGPLQGIRVTIDSDVRRPYWLEQGTQRTFAFRDSIAVTEAPPQATITVQGQPVSAAARRADGSVVVRRADLAAGR